MYPIKQSTAETIVFFAHDVNGDAVTGMVDGGFTKRISKGSGAFAAMTVTITEMENGWYSFPLSTTHSDTVGLLTISLSNASCKRINLLWRVSARTLDELASPTNITGGTITTVTTVTGLTASDVGAIKAKTDNLPAAPSAVSDIPTATQNADALLNRDMSAVSDTNARSPLNALRFLRNKWSMSGSTLTVTKENDSTSAWTATVTTDAAAVPIVGNDPA
jgi:hypothetical protein